MSTMPRAVRKLSPLLYAVALACGALWASTAHAELGRETVCTITVNSSDEKHAFERYLPKARFDYVELVERGRPDWLEAALRKHVRCDILVISGHYDGGDYAGGNEFFSEHVDAREYLPVDEMERVACSNPDDGPFAHLKAVFLFGCNTLNSVALRSSPEEIARTLVASGHSSDEASRLARAMSPRFADSSRDRMRHIFRNVPAIYGFSSVAPLGPLAATYLDRYFRAGGAREVASGVPSTKLLSYFPGRSLTVTRGSTDADPDVGFRHDTCQFLDDRISPVARAQFVHALLHRDMAEVRLFLDRLERYARGLKEHGTTSPELSAALAAIAEDADARDRYLRFMRALDDPSLAVRMIDLAYELHWFSDDQRRAELGNLIAQRYDRSILTAADVDFACKLDVAHALDGTRATLAPPKDVGQAAIRGCLGDDAQRATLLGALTSADTADVQIAQVYLGYHPIAGVTELREIASAIGTMRDAHAQVRALDTLADHRVSDPETLAHITRLFEEARSIEVQRAIAGVLLRSDYPPLAMPTLARTLREHRLESHEGRDLIDVLIDRLDVSA
ncbi:MAG TPA: hypothetical protein VJ891_16030 [Casimicrobiaceae bacterium]|nr:hypothetical protein [Casimicrobiaceae bacterium]